MFNELRSCISSCDVKNSKEIAINIHWPIIKKINPFFLIGHIDFGFLFLTSKKQENSVPDS
jgi:hypothetical protein